MQHASGEIGDGATSDAQGPGGAVRGAGDAGGGSPGGARSPDAFDVLGMPARFDLDRAALQQAYLARSAVAHPDAGGAGDAEDDQAQAAARLNDAHATLLDPERRAGALLARLGGPSKEQDRTLPPGFLAGMMEVREELEAARAAGDAAGIARFEAWAEGERREWIKRVGAGFAAAGAGPGGPTGAMLRELRAQLNAWRYIERMLENLDETGAARGM